MILNIVTIFGSLLHNTIHYYVGTETGFHSVLEWSLDVYPVQKCPIPDSRTESERILHSFDMTFLGREIRSIYRTSIRDFYNTFFPDWAAGFYRGCAGSS